MLVLASASPRRRELMRMITTEFEALAADIDESLPPKENPRRTAELLAFQKAEAVLALRPADVVIGCDTIVALGSRILGKPRDPEEAADMLRALSGRTHGVVTGVCILGRGKREVFSQYTDVTFFPLSEEEILLYASSGDPLDKAGGYGIQSGAALFVSGIRGDYYNVMGLPVGTLSRKLREFAGNKNKL